MRGRKLSIEEQEQKLEVDKAERRRIFKELCMHLAKGLSVESFFLVSGSTISRMFEKYPEEFSMKELEIAKNQGRHTWENIGLMQSNGSCLGNSRSWYYNMANRYGWREKIDIEAEHKGSVNVNVISYASQKARDADTSNE